MLMPRVRLGRIMVSLAIACFSPHVLKVVAAQAPLPAEPSSPRTWDVQIGASFVGTRGNSRRQRSANFGLHRRWPLWQFEATALAVRASAEEVEAERYVGAVRTRRRLMSLIAFAAGTRLERDQFAGIDSRAISDQGRRGHSSDGPTGRSTG